MAIIVNSPHSGQPVKVRDQDVGRAVKDEEGRIFYVMPKSDGSGYFGSITRSGPGVAKDEARALEMENKQAVRRGNVHEQVETVRAPARKSGIGGKVFVVVVLAVIAAVGYWVFVAGGMDTLRGYWTQPPPAAQPQAP